MSEHVVCLSAGTKKMLTKMDEDTLKAFESYPGCFTKVNVTDEELEGMLKDPRIPKAWKD